jgi:hypothetical protein
MVPVRLVIVVLLAACGFDAKLQPTVADAPQNPGGEITIPACFGNRCRRITLTIDHTKVDGGPHANFPLYVQLIEPDLTNALPSGADLAFTIDGITALAYERERFSAPDLFAWVLVPSISSIEDTRVHLYYGDPAATDTQNRNAVWDANYHAVWHLAEKTGGAGAIKDSTSNANHGTDCGNPAFDARGKLGPALAFDGVDDCIRIPQAVSLANTAARATLEMWVNWTQPQGTDYQRLLMSTNTFANDLRGMEWATNPTGGYYYYPSDGGQLNNNYAGFAQPFTLGTWHHVALTQDFATKTVEMYVDGTSRTITATGLPASWTNLTTAADWYWGGVPPRTKFLGRMDEIRVSNILRSAGWIATQVANQSAPTMFYTAATVSAP